VGPPPPGATRGLGVFVAFRCHSSIYASQRMLSMGVFDVSAGGSMHPSAWKGHSRKFGYVLPRVSSFSYP
jgi:hypothetical protein